MVNLDSQGKKTLPLTFKIFPHGKNGQQELAIVVYIEIAGREFQSRHHGNVKGIVGRAVLRCIAFGFGVNADIGVIVF